MMDKNYGKIIARKNTLYLEDHKKPTLSLFFLHWGGKTSLHLQSMRSCKYEAGSLVEDGLTAKRKLVLL